MISLVTVVSNRNPKVCNGMEVQIKYVKHEVKSSVWALVVCRMIVCQITLTFSPFTSFIPELCTVARCHLLICHQVISICSIDEPARTEEKQASASAVCKQQGHFR